MAARSGGYPPAGSGSASSAHEGVDPDRYPGCLTPLSCAPDTVIRGKFSYSTRPQSPLIDGRHILYDAHPVAKENLQASPKLPARNASRPSCQVALPKPPRNDIFALHADMSHQRNGSLQNFYDDKVKKR